MALNRLDNAYENGTIDSVSSVITLNGARDGFQTFSSAGAVDTTVYYCKVVQSSSPTKWGYYPCTYAAAGTLTLGSIHHGPGGIDGSSNVRVYQGLSTLDTDDFASLTGVSGGQVLIGGTSSGDDLTLQSTSHATKGLIAFGSNSAYDEVNDRLGIGTQAPGDNVHVKGANPGIKLENTSSGNHQISNESYSLAIEVDPENAVANSTFVIDIDGTPYFKLDTASYIQALKPFTTADNIESTSALAGFRLHDRAVDADSVEIYSPTAGDFFIYNYDKSATMLEMDTNGQTLIKLATENLKVVDAGSVGATQQDWVQVEVGGVTGYIHIYAAK